MGPTDICLPSWERMPTPTCLPYRRVRPWTLVSLPRSAAENPQVLIMAASFSSLLTVMEDRGRRGRAISRTLIGIGFTTVTTRTVQIPAQADKQSHNGNRTNQRSFVAGMVAFPQHIPGDKHPAVAIAARFCACGWASFSPTARRYLFSLSLSIFRGIPRVPVLRALP